MIKILITGGRGFIARNLAEQLSGDFEVFSPGRNDLDLLNTEKVCEFLKKEKFDAIIHAANYDADMAYSLKDPALVLEYNLKMFYNIARCENDFGKLLFFGSGAEFGRQHWIPKMKEDYFDHFVPEDQYGLSKYIMTKQALLSKNIINLRLFGVFGKYDDWQRRFIPNLCSFAIHDMPLKISQNRRFDFLYVDDLAQITKWFVLNKPEKKVYNICSGQVWDFETVAEKIKIISGKDLGIVVKQQGSGVEYSGDNSLLVNEICGLKFTSFDDALTDTYNWYREHKAEIDKDKLL